MGTLTKFTILNATGVVLIAGAFGIDIDPETAEQIAVSLGGIGPLLNIALAIWLQYKKKKEQAVLHAVVKSQSGFILPSLLRPFAGVMLVLVATLAFLPGCSIFDGNNEAAERLAVAVGVRSVVGSGPDYAERAKEIERVTVSIKSRLNEQVAVDSDLLGAAIRNAIPYDRLSPPDVLLVNDLVNAVVAELQSKIKLGEIPSDALFRVEQVADWVIAAARAYQQGT